MVAQCQCYLYLFLLLSLVGTSCGTFLGGTLTGQVSAVHVASVLVGIVTGFPPAITLFSINYTLAKAWRSVCYLLLLVLGTGVHTF